jgi:hypothetical protein
MKNRTAMEPQIERDRVYKFIETVNAIRKGQAQGVPLAEYWPREIADAIQYLIETAVHKEREECAAIADAENEPSGFAARGEPFEVQARREVSMKIAAGIRARG